MNRNHFQTKSDKFKIVHKMPSRDDLKELKKFLQESAANLDAESFRKKAEAFRDRFKDILKPDELAQIEKKLADLKKNDRPMATYHEFVLFLVVAAFLISVFGENIPIKWFFFSPNLQKKSLKKFSALNYFKFL